MQRMLRKAAVVGLVVAASVLSGQSAASAETATDGVDVSCCALVLVGTVSENVVVGESDYDGDSFAGDVDDVVVIRPPGETADKVDSVLLRGGEVALGVLGGGGPFPGPAPPIVPEVTERAAAIVEWAGDRALGVLGGGGPFPGPAPPITPGELISRGDVDYSAALVSFDTVPVISKGGAKRR